MITGKFSLAELYKKAGYNKETLSKGKYAELLLDSRTFNETEAELFNASAQHAYEQFRNKAASSRGMDVESMQEVAQGRVWSGKRAATIGLVDAVGGINRAVALAKEAADIKPEEKVRLLEISREQISPLALLTGGGATVFSPLQAMMGVMVMLQAVVANNGGMKGMSPAAAVGAPALMQVVAAMGASGMSGGGVDGTSSEASFIQNLAQGQVLAQLPELTIDGVVSKTLLSSSTVAQWESGCGSDLFDC